MEKEGSIFEVAVAVADTYVFVKKDGRGAVEEAAEAASIPPPSPLMLIISACFEQSELSRGLVGGFRLLVQSQRSHYNDPKTVTRIGKKTVGVCSGFECE
jgi:hypothetical protein